MCVGERVGVGVYAKVSINRIIGIVSAFAGGCVYLNVNIYIIYIDVYGGVNRDMFIIIEATGGGLI
jgi:hypothetical protein